MRQQLIERIFDAQEYPDDICAVYSNIFYSFAKSLKMEPSYCKEIFPWLIDPMYEQYKMNPLNCKNIICKIISRANINVLQDIAEQEEEDVEYYDYDSD